MRNNFPVAGLIAAVGVLLTISSCSKPKEEEKEPVVPVQVAEVKRDSIDRIITAQGILYPVDQANVMPKISAPVKTFHIKRSDHVKQGQLLPVLENKELQAAVGDSKGAFEQAQAAKSKFEGAQAQLSYSEVRSPISGIIADRPLYAGEMASAGAPLLTVMNISRVIARANVPVAQAAILKAGQSARITQTDASLQATGKVTVVSPAVDPNSTTVEAWVEAANPAERLKPGATVRVDIHAETVKDAVVIPKDALLPSAEGGVQVMVVGAHSKAHEKKVEVGIREPEKVQIVKGVDAGEKVIVVGGVGLEDGGKVQIKAAGEEEKSEKGEKPDKDEDKAEKPDKK